jgi:hypothetical protein
MSESNSSYFQYHRDCDYPVFICLEAVEFSENVVGVLEQLSFREIKGNEIDSMHRELSENRNARQLCIKKAGYKAVSQIEAAASTDRYGHESILPKSGYKVYRFKSQALIVYSYAASVWECGVTEQFCREESDFFAARTVLNRFLSWSLAPLGVLGFWGVPVEEGAVVLKQNNSQGEVFFIDVQKRKFLSMDGATELSVRFKLLRLDRHLKNKNIKMGSDELLSFLSVHTSYFDPEGNSLAVRQLLSALSRLCEGLIHPMDSFSPRSDISL